MMFGQADRGWRVGGIRVQAQCNCEFFICGKVLGIESDAARGTSSAAVHRCISVSVHGVLVGGEGRGFVSVHR